MPAELVLAWRVVGPDATTSAPLTGLPAESRMLEMIAPSETVCAKAGAPPLANRVKARGNESGDTTFKAA
jgi:hypothetical protein